jgi:nucleoside 2-deoxyribosyltransferase
MRAYIAIKYHPDSRNRSAIDRISRALEENGYDTVCIARDVEEWGQVHLAPEELMQRSFEALDGSDIVIVDLTEKGVGIGIEAGYAWARGIPIVTIAKSGSDISSTLQGISWAVVGYDGYDELVELFAQVLAQGE